NGVTYMFNSGAAIDNPLGYRFSQHPGTHVLLAVLHKLTGIDAHTLFLLMSALFASIFVVMSALLLRALTGCPFGLGGLIMLLFQESYSAAYYANSTVIAGAFCISGFYLLAARDSWRHHTIGALLFGLAVFMRLDVILLALVVAPLLYRGSTHQAAIKTIVVGSIAGSVWAATYFGSGASIGDVMAAMGDKEQLFTYAQETHNTVISHVAYFSVLTVFLTVMGVASMVTQHKWHILAIIGFAIIPFYVLFPHGLGTSRYLFYFTPFFALPVAQALWNVRPRPASTWFVYASLIAVLFVGQYALGTRWATTTEGDIKVRLHAGPGNRFVGVSNNGGRLFTGLLYSPLWHRDLKKAARLDMEELDAYLGEVDSDIFTFYAIGWTPAQLSIKALISQGAVLKDEVTDRQQGWSRYLFDRSGQSITLVFLRSVAVNRALLTPTSSPIADIGHPNSFVVTRPYWAKQLGMDKEKSWHQAGKTIFVWGAAPR
ncbi:MAG: hypothetical protein ACR2QU_04810, partial [Gammaproteobacteria bacterium]